MSLSTGAALKAAPPLWAFQVLRAAVGARNERSLMICSAPPNPQARIMSMWRMWALRKKMEVKMYCVSRCVSALQVCLLAASGAAFSAESSTTTSRAALLNLRAPPIEQVMPRDELLAEIGASNEPVEIVVQSPLLPMTSDSDPPLGIVDSGSWSVTHPTPDW